jgi:hypothetical protein
MGGDHPKENKAIAGAAKDQPPSPEMWTAQSTNDVAPHSAANPSGAATKRDRFEAVALITYFAMGFRSGNRMTSRMDCAFVKSIASRSMPIPSPAVGGMPCSSARM